MSEANPAGMEYSATAPLVLTLATLLEPVSVTQREPSADVMEPGPACAEKPENSVTVPPGVMRPTLLAAFSVNHTFPSGPPVISARPALLLMPLAYSVIVPDGVMEPMRLLNSSVNQT